MQKPNLLIEILGIVSEGQFTLDPLGMSIRTTEDRIMVGRRPDDRIETGLWLYLASISVSPCHALIYFKEEAWRIRDLGSENGTWIYKDNPKHDYIQDMVIDEKLEVVFGWVVARLTVQKQHKE
jgi:hypothetical protein